MSREQSMSMSDEPQEEFMSIGQPTRSPCRRASRTRTPCPWTSHTKTPCDGGVGRTFTGGAASERPRRCQQRHPHRGSAVLEAAWSRLDSYRITVRGRLTKRLMYAFDGLDVEPGIEQTTVVGEIRDQSHLFGVLDKVRGLGPGPRQCGKELGGVRARR